MTAPIGHNSAAGDQIKSVVERVERLLEEKKAIAEDISEVLKEAKNNGLDAKIIRKVIRLRAQDKTKREEEEALTELYLSALGMI